VSTPTQSFVRLFGFGAVGVSHGRGSTAGEAIPRLFVASWVIRPTLSGFVAFLVFMSVATSGFWTPKTRSRMQAAMWPVLYVAGWLLRYPDDPSPRVFTHVGLIYPPAEFRLGRGVVC